ncbi:hypothetical protein FNQ90_24240 [Streptomyces alkaliphilus]|uniref:DUF3995 domain-containing protein n=1 Tax=Streptomyces alkaliphilus TaxID=1472722 RepID=A0A7W3Y476_9ACTN|nr:hypothetical protein [Streptomyces alkaliphilus]MBB0247150.1 hypothetical protein [Streptomyces alkaliphilus]
MSRMRISPGVPRWAALAAHAVPLLTLPSGLWRIALAAGLPVSEISLRDGREVLYVVSLSVLLGALALLTLGLVQPWGEVVPRWIPLLGGRGVPPLAATVPALLGGIALAGLFSRAFHSHCTGVGQEAIGTPAQYALLWLCYLPLLAWPPLLISVAIAYHRRRTAFPLPRGSGSPSRGGTS